jgi:hypothetical protein
MDARTEEIPRSQIGHDVIKRIGRHLVNSSIGFVKLEQPPQGKTASLAGSGTLVKAGDTYAILTAHHVVAELPKKGPLGLVMFGYRAPFTVEAQDLKLVKIARGPIDRDGPDIGAVILSPEIAGSLAAKKSFLDLNMHRDRMLLSPPDIDDGVWILLGFVAERTTEEASTGGYDVLMKFVEFALAGDVNPPFESGGHDYFDLIVGFSDPGVPRDFKGMSGGGLWQVSLKRDATGQLTHKQAFLSGVPFYQEPVAGNRSLVRCHGRRSIYDVAYAKLTGS